MKEDLSNKITFVFREDGYLGFFGDGFWIGIERNVKAYMELKSGDKVSMITRYDRMVYGTIWREYKQLYIIQDRAMSDYPSHGEWKKYGEYGWVLTNSRGFVFSDHADLKLYKPLVPNLIVDKEEIKNLKNNMHFSLVI